jgi:Fe2+ or Zn2+ uptake regulation protein
MLEKCIKAGLQMTNQRVSIASTLDESLDHPDAEAEILEIAVFAIKCTSGYKMINC